MLMIFKYILPQAEPPLQARSSSIPKIRKWSKTPKFYEALGQRMTERAARALWGLVKSLNGGEINSVVVYTVLLFVLLIF